MSSANFIDEIRNKEFSKYVLSIIGEIEALYNCTIDDEAKGLMKFNESSFYDYKERTFRVMGVSEILTASDSLGFDFVSKKLLPLIDTMDNDFICYDMFNKEFLLFGLVEELDIVTKKDISDLIDDIS